MKGEAKDLKQQATEGDGALGDPAVLANALSFEQAKNKVLLDEVLSLEDALVNRQMVEFDAVNAKAFGLNVRQSADGKNAVTIKYENDILNVAGTEVKLPSVAKDKKLTLHVFIDKSVLEVFINGGRATVTRAEYPGLQDMAVSVFAEGGKATVKSFDAWELKSIYK